MLTLKRTVVMVLVGVLAGCSQSADPVAKGEKRNEPAPVEKLESPKKGDDTRAPEKKVDPTPKKENRPEPKVDDPVLRTVRLGEVLRAFAKPNQIQTTCSVPAGNGDPNLSSDKAMKAAQLAAEVIKLRGVAGGLADACRQCASKFDATQLVVFCEEGPQLNEVQAKLGKDEGQEKAAVLQKGITWYRYGWVDLGASEDGKVWAIRADCKKAPAGP